MADGVAPPFNAWALFRGGWKTVWGVNSSRLPTLDAMRALSILLVCMVHWPARFYRGGGINVGLHNIPLFSMGYVGVDAFYVLSGYLIGRQIWKEVESTGTVYFPRFFIRRTLRIWPYYYFALAAWTIYRPQESGPARVSELFFFANYTDIRGIPGSWSLSTEEQFYILAPALVIILSRVLKPKHFLWILGGIELAMIAARYFEVNHQILTTGKVEYLEALHLHADGLIAGMSIALVSVLKPAWFKGENKSLKGWLFFGACVGAGGVLYKIQPKVMSFTTLALVFGGLLVALLLDKTVVRKILSVRIFQVFSVLTFGIYLNQFVVLSTFGAFWGKVSRTWMSPQAAFFVGFVIAIALCVAMATATYLLIEHPFLVVRDKWIEKMSAKRTAPRPKGTPG